MNASNPVVLWIARAIPWPLDAGGKVYTSKLAAAASRAGARIVFPGLAPAGGVDRTRLPPGIDWQVVPGAEAGPFPALLHPRLPLVTARASPAGLRAAIGKRLESQTYDAIVIDGYQAGWALEMVMGAPGRPRLIHIAHNHEATLAGDITRDFRGSPLKQLALSWNAGKIARLEQRIVAAADCTVTLTDEDAERFRTDQPATRTLTPPPGYEGERRASRHLASSVPRRVVMLGSVRWVAKQMNVAAFIDAADARFAAEGIELHIIGDTPESFVARWPAGKLRATTFRGFVDDVEHELDQARAGLMIEATGGGFKLKILDYLYNRVPVFALAGSFAGLPPAVYQAFSMAPDMPSLVERIVTSIDDLQALDASHDTAFRNATGLFDWDDNGRRLVRAMSDGTSN